MAEAAITSYGPPDVPRLRGRERICDRLAALVEAIRGGESRVLVLRGEPGIGKTALLEYAAEIADDVRIARAAGVESEAAIPFAGLHELCAPLLDRAEDLPAPQRDALRLVFGLDGGGEPDRLLVGLAVLGLLTAVGRDQALLCVVDDAHLLDRASAQVLGLVARRLRGEPVGLLLAGRASGSMERFAGLEEHTVERLAEPDARRLLAAAVQVPLDEGVRDRLVVEARGNPRTLALVSPVEVAGGLGLTGRLSTRRRLGSDERRRLERLPTATMRLLLLAAAEPLGDPVLLWRAARLLGIEQEAARAAEAAELVELGQRVSFRDPLLRSAIYEEAAPAERRAAHRALAAATDPRLDPDRHAWHRGQAAERADEELAGELVGCAGRRRARGCAGDAAALLERASLLTWDPALRAGRALAAAEAMHQTGAHRAALELLAAADLRPLDRLQRARLDRLRGLIALDQRHAAEAFGLLRRAGRALAPLDRGLARLTYRDALGAAAYAGRFLDPGERAGLAREARELGAGDDGGLTEASLPGRFPLLPRGEAELREGGERCVALAARQVERARGAGAVATLPYALGFHAAALLLRGEFVAAAARVEEANAVAASSRIEPLPHAALLLAAWRGREAETRRLCAECAKDASARGEGLLLGLVDYASAVLDNGLGRYPLALDAAARACERGERSLFSWAAAELVEAASRAGRPQQAAAALDGLHEQARGGGEWALGIEARSRALLSEGDVAERCYREAIERLAGAGHGADLGRAHLLYGEWLRREGRRVDAREQLRPALRMFMSMGAQGFAARAEHELAATAETTRARTVENADELTTQEETVAQLAREGFSNPEIGSRLFISPRTVEYHLRKVFRKLGVRSRHELAGALAAN